MIIWEWRLPSGYSYTEYDEWDRKEWEKWMFTVKLDQDILWIKVSTNWDSYLLDSWIKSIHEAYSELVNERQETATAEVLEQAYPWITKESVIALGLIRGSDEEQTLRNITEGTVSTNDIIQKVLSTNSTKWILFKEAE